MLIYGLCAKAWPLQCVVWLLWSGWRIPRLWDCQFTGGGWQRDSRPGPELRARCINMEWKFLAFKIQPELRPHRVSFQCVRLPYSFLKISFKPQRNEKLASKFFSYITSHITDNQSHRQLSLWIQRHNEDWFLVFVSVCVPLQTESANSSGIWA